MLCHADIHGGNILIDDDGALSVVDWDGPVLAPAERRSDVRRRRNGRRVADHQQSLFWQGYGIVELNWPALAYYRYQRPQHRAPSLMNRIHTMEPDVRGEYVLRPATEADVAAVTELVDAAYGHYVARIGRRPGPMMADYGQVISDSAVTVAVRQEAVVGLIVLAVTSEGFLVENVAVHPSQQGHGLGRALLAFAEAEAKRVGFDSLYLYTHEKMTENIALYQRLGYVEYDRRAEAGFARVFLRKQLWPLVA